MRIHDNCDVKTLRRGREGNLRPTIRQVGHPVWSLLVTGLRRRFLVMQKLSKNIRYRGERRWWPDHNFFQKKIFCGSLFIRVFKF